MTSLRGSCFGIALLALAATARAEVTGITYSRSSPFGARMFGSAGTYEQLDGTVSGDIDPTDPHNRIIQDIERAPRNARGKVDYGMTFSILKPVDLSKSNHTLVYDVVNRGNKRRAEQHAGLPAGRIRYQSHLRARLYGQGSEGDGDRVCRYPRPGRFPAGQHAKAR